MFLDASNIKTTRPSPKLAHRYLGPYPIVQAVGTHAYCLKLPRSMSRIHPVFNVIKLLPAPRDLIPGRRAWPLPDPELVAGALEYEIDQIKDS